MMTIGWLIYDEMQAIDFVGPLDVFGSANSQHSGKAGPYALCTIGLTKQPVRAENGARFLPDMDMSDAPELDTLFIPGGIASRRTLSSNAALLDWLRARAATSRRLAAVCTGAFTLAATGLLDGRRATTHWRFAADFRRRFPAVHLHPDQLYLQDGKFYSSGGLTAGMDLALSLVEADLGAAAALCVARDLLMYVRRPGNQAQFSAPLQAQMRGAGRLAELVDWLLAHLHEDLDAERLAERAHMSARSLRRLFRDRFGMTPARYVEQLRIEHACILLTAGAAPVEKVAVASGFASADVFRRAFRARYGASPSEYRQRFAARGLAGKVGKLSVTRPYR